MMSNFGYNYARMRKADTSGSSELNPNNKKFWEELIIHFPSITL
jgi:hypothetical protein